MGGATRAGAERAVCGREEGGDQGEPIAFGLWQGEAHLLTHWNPSRTVQLLELDPATFAPTLSLKYGRHLPPNARNALRIQLHPACVPPEEDDYGYGYEEEAYDYEDGAYAGYKKRPKFGEPLVDEGEDRANGVANWARRGVWEGEWQEGVRVVA